MYLSSAYLRLLWTQFLISKIKLENLVDLDMKLCVIEDSLSSYFDSGSKVRK